MALHTIATSMGFIPPAITLENLNVLQMPDTICKLSRSLSSFTSHPSPASESGPYIGFYWFCCHRRLREIITRVKGPCNTRNTLLSEVCRICGHVKCKDCLMKAQEAEDLSKPSITETSENEPKPTAEDSRNSQGLRMVPRKRRGNRRKLNPKAKSKPTETVKAIAEEDAEPTTPQEVVNTTTTEAFDEAILC